MGCILMIVMCLTVAAGVVSALAQGEDDLQNHPNCKYCGMDRKQFSHSRILVRYDDGTLMGACSIHCVAVDLAVNIDKTPMAVEVADFGTKKLIDAESAVWVVGGSKPGVMTQRAKWAFAKKEDAENFVKENGGAVAGFDEVMKAAYEDMWADTKMIREKRKMRKMHMQGQKTQ